VLECLASLVGEKLRTGAIAPPSSTTMLLRSGSNVEVLGLQSAAGERLNGRRGVVVGFDPSSTRYSVSIVCDGSVLATVKRIQACNLHPAPVPGCEAVTHEMAAAREAQAAVVSRYAVYLGNEPQPVAVAFEMFSSWPETDQMLAPTLAQDAKRVGCTLVEFRTLSEEELLTREAQAMEDVINHVMGELLPSRFGRPETVSGAHVNNVLYSKSRCYIFLGPQLTVLGPPNRERRRAGGCYQQHARRT
jgi:hypothetical protein